MSLATPAQVGSGVAVLVSPRALRALACPACRGPLALGDARFQCEAPGCGRAFPVIDGVPVLIDETTSLFSLEEYRQGRVRVADTGPSGAAGALGRWLPRLSENRIAEANVDRLQRELPRRSEPPLVLIIGGATLGDGLQGLLTNPALTCIETDIVFGPRTQMVCDAHRLPFADGALDGVVIQAVLEHVLEPQQCVDEISRVLGEHGVVYCELPFIQQVHLGRYDFARFTHVGLRYLFRRFDEIASGVVCGPGTALAWSYQYFLLSFVRSPVAQRLVRVFARLTAFGLKYLDRLLGGSAGALDAASAYYFIGRKSLRTLSGREVLATYRGLQGG